MPFEERKVFPSSKRTAVQLNRQLVVGSYQKLVIKSPFPSINDASWYQFRKLEYFGVKFGKVTVAVN
ncbi:MAG: hypothetical protein ABWU13_24175, partial [Limnospira maxima]